MQTPPRPPSPKALLKSRVRTRRPPAQNIDRSTGCSYLYFLNGNVGLDYQVLLLPTGNRRHCHNLGDAPLAQPQKGHLPHFVCRHVGAQIANEQ